MLIVFAMMLFTSASIAQTILYERGITTDWSDTDLTDWGGSAATLQINNGLYLAASNSSYENALNVTTQDNSKLTLNLVWNTATSTGRANSYNYISFGFQRKSC